MFLIFSFVPNALGVDLGKGSATVFLWKGEKEPKTQ